MATRRGNRATTGTSRIPAHRIEPAERGSGDGSLPRAPGISVAQRVSQLFREARRERGLTLEELQQAIIGQSHGQITKIALSHLSRIETGQKRPTDVELYWINEVLKRPLGVIFGSQENYPWYVVRSPDVEGRMTEIREQRKIVERKNDAHEHFIKNFVYRIVPLVGSDLTRTEGGTQAAELLPKFFVQLIEFQTIEWEEMEVEKALDRHEGQEGIYCLEGELEFWIEEKARDGKDRDQVEQHRLRRGDFVHFDPRRRHGFRSTGPKPARALQILYEEPEIRAPVKKQKQ